MSETKKDPRSHSASADPSIYPEGGEHHTVLTLIGGDARQLAVAEALSEAGHTVRLYGIGGMEAEGVARDGNIPQGVRLFGDLHRALEGCDGVVLPYPVSKDGETVHCPLHDGKAVPLAEIGSYIAKHPTVKVFGGRIPKAYGQTWYDRGSTLVDYEESEAFLIKNALLTAEGAVMTAMELTDTAVLGMSVAVIGYGRIGSLLARLLTAMGAKVTVFARRAESLAMAEAQGSRGASTGEIMRLCEGYRVIFNTVPEILLSKALLMSLPCDTLVIELASAPGGLDPEGVREATRRCGLQVVFAPSLPGRYAPKDAGRAIADCILSCLEKDSACGEVTV